MPEGDVRAVESWLRSRNATLFGQFFDVSVDTRPAAEWFVQNMEEFIAFTEGEQRAQRIDYERRKDEIRNLYGQGTTLHTVDL